MTTIKDRVLKISDYKEVSKQKFFKDLGLSYANFKGVQKKSALNSDAIDKILTNYNEINYEWLVSGKGPMLKAEKPTYPSHLVGKPDSVEEIRANEMFAMLREGKENYAKKENPGTFIASLEDHIATLKLNNQYFIKRITYLEAQLMNCNCTNTTENQLKVAEKGSSYTLKKDK